MVILTIRTDNPEAEIGLFDGRQQLAYESWHAHRQLAETLHSKIEALLASKGMELKDLQGIVAFKGPGSFTGLRIGLTVANTLSYSLNIPVVAKNGQWKEDGIDDLLAGKGEKTVTPEYGGDANTTPPRK